MNKKIIALLSMLFATALLAGCAFSPTEIGVDSHLPKTGDKGFVAFSVVCQSQHKNKLERILQLSRGYNSVRLNIEDVNGGIYGGYGLVGVTCNNIPEYKMFTLPAGSYKLNQIYMENGHADIDVRFNVMPNHVNYIGRISIDARDATRIALPGDFIYTEVSNAQTIDLPYFQLTYKNIDRKSYLINSAVNFSSDSI